MKKHKRRNQAANNANNVAEDLINRRYSGEFKGDKGDKGDKGEQGESGVMATTSGMFSLYLGSDTGDYMLNILMSQALRNLNTIQKLEICIT